jgi:hypothetical protein
VGGEVLEDEDEDMVYKVHLVPLVGGLLPPSLVLD